MLRDQIDGALKAALKVQDSARLATLRLMNAAVRDRDILYYDEGKLEVDDQQIQSVLRKCSNSVKRQCVCIKNLVAWS